MDLVRSIAAVFFPWRRHFSRSPEPGENPEWWLGRRGEDLAVRHLRRNGCKVLYRNFRAPRGGEVDIVCRDKTCNELVFVEVKTRRTRDYGSPASAVNFEKQKLITRGALAWLRMLDNPNIIFRFDIVEVIIDAEGESLNIVRAAFQLPNPHRY
jgi:putative endonuclease